MKEKIALIGPVLPFRGGIAQHTTMLHRELSSMADTLTLSFSRQYPAFLFPGESDRDPDTLDHREPGVTYTIDSMNPLTWRRAVDDVVAHGAKAVVIPWWTFFWAPCFGYIAGRLARVGVPTVFLCHNVVDHDATGWKARLSRRTLARGAAFVTHTSSDNEALAVFATSSPAVVQPHPTYDQFPPAKSELPRRAGLEMLFFGFVRPYKGLDVLIEAMPLLADVDVMLSVAGEFWEGEEETRRRIVELGLEDRVEIESGYLGDQDVAERFARADIVVLPYRSATGSGVIALAYHYDKPVIATKVGGLPDVIDDGDTGYLVEPDSPEELAEAIRLAAVEAKGMTEAVRTKKGTMTWGHLAEAVLKMVEAAGGRLG